MERCRREKSWLGHSFLINSLLCLLFTAAGVVYLMNTDFLTIADFFSHGGLLIASLLIGTAAAAWCWHKRRSFLTVFIILTVMAYGFGSALIKFKARFTITRRPTRSVKILKS